MRSRLGAVDDDRRPVIVGDLGHGPHGHGAPRDVAGVLDGNDLHIMAHGLLEGLHVEPPLAVGPDDAPFDPHVLLKEQPRDVVRVMLRVRRDDDVAPAEAESVRGGVESLGAVLGEHVAVWIVGTEEGGKLLTGLVHRHGDPRRHGVDAASAARRIVLVVVRNRTDDAVRPQGLACAVQIDPLSRPHCRVVPADGIDVHAPPILLPLLIMSACA